MERKIQLFLLVAGFFIFSHFFSSPVIADGFIHAPRGDWSKAHEDIIINYLTWGGSEWTAKLIGKTFLHAPRGDWSKSHKDTIINYLTWGGSEWTAKLK